MIEAVFLILLSYMLTLKVVFFGDNVPKDRADKAMETAKACDAFLVLGSSLMTMSAYRLVRCLPFLYICFLLK
jgi:NAD-dependent SIR2 family protein deacetylase